MNGRKEVGSKGKRASLCFIFFTQKMTAAGQNQSAAVICFVSLMQYKSYLCFAAESIASQNKRDDVRDG